LITIWFLGGVAGCGSTDKLTPFTDDFGSLEFGTAETLDIVTWNLKVFPLNNQTITHLVSIIPQMKVDVIAFQEIMDASSLYDLANQLPYYNAYVYSATTSYRLAYLYDTRTVTVNAEYTIFNGQTNPFPRAPYVLDISFSGQDYIIINNHFKALGDNVIDESDEWDEEMRRRQASELLEGYINENLSTDRVVVLGDLNDQIQEPVETNVFMAFLNKPEEYLFTTMPMALNPTIYSVSYPSYNSQIDHILISNELYEDFDAAGNVCRLIRVENYFGGLYGYYTQLSDHRPVGIRLPPPLE
jgi:endonuclease/exonuclease/phosphatase family metal-dependent hydrolase